MTLSSFRVGVAAASLTVLASAAVAAPVTYSVQGIVDVVNSDGANVFQGRVSAGSAFEATFTFDNARVDEAPLDPRYASYRGPGSGTLKIGSMPLVLTSAASTVDVYILNDPFVDEYQVVAELLDLPPPVPGAVPVRVAFTIDFISFTNLSALTSDALLPELPDVDAFEHPKFAFTTIWELGGSRFVSTLEGHVTPVQVSEPTAAALMAAVVGVFAGARRRRGATSI